MFYRHVDTGCVGVGWWMLGGAVLCETQRTLVAQINAANKANVARKEKLQDSSVDTSVALANSQLKKYTGIDYEALARKAKRS